LSQVKLAARADIDPSTMNQIERGVREPSASTLRKLAAALDVSIADLLEDDSPKALQAPLPLEYEPTWGFTPEEITRLEALLREHGLSLLAMPQSEFKEIVENADARALRDIADKLNAEWRSLEPIRKSGSGPGVILALFRVAARWDQAAGRISEALHEEVELAESTGAGSW
jgi:transcriptional regulator with XRE-family HTH domain